LTKGPVEEPALSFVEVFATPSVSNTTLWSGPVLRPPRTKRHRTNRSIRTEQAYVNWIKRYIYFHNVRHPAEMGAPQVQAFLTHLAVEENVAASTQNQALSPWALYLDRTGLSA